VLRSVVRSRHLTPDRPKRNRCATPMLSKLGRISLLAFQVVWLLVILPGHQRGAITLPGSPVAQASCDTQAVAESHSCCAPRHPSSDPKSKTPDSDRTSHCAVCHYAIRMVFVAPPDLTVAPAGFVELMPVPRVHNQYARPISLVHDARGPPTA
jgi:hypothetical protein